MSHIDANMRSWIKHFDIASQQNARTSSSSLLSFMHTYADGQRMNAQMPEMGIIMNVCDIDDVVLHNHNIPVFFSLSLLVLVLLVPFAHVRWADAASYAQTPSANATRRKANHYSRRLWIFTSEMFVWLTIRFISTVIRNVHINIKCDRQSMYIYNIPWMNDGNDIVYLKTADDIFYFLLLHLSCEHSTCLDMHWNVQMWCWIFVLSHLFVHIETTTLFYSISSSFIPCASPTLRLTGSSFVCIQQNPNVKS